MAVRAGQWWSMAHDTFDRPLREFLTRAKAAERREHPDHECGHEFVVTVTMKGHSSGVVGEEPPVHTDANYTMPMGPVTVRAHDLRMALLLAAAEPLDAWSSGEDGA